MSIHAGGTVVDFVARFLVERGEQIIDVRDEGAAVHTARAHAALPGQVGVAQATAGPGVTNCVTAIASAHIERLPLLRTGSCPPSPQDYLARRKVSTSGRSSRHMLRNAHSIKREEKPVDLARTALYPLGDLSAFVCGQTIVVDGGPILC